MLIEYVYKKIEQLIQVTITVNAVAQNKDKVIVVVEKQLLLLLLRKTKCQDNMNENLEVGRI